MAGTAACALPSCIAHPGDARRGPSAVASAPAEAARAPPPRSIGRPDPRRRSLARAYDFILDARFDQVDAELRRACGPAPPEACERARRHGAVVADPARSRATARSTTSSRTPSTRDRSDRGLDRARAGRRRGVVLPRRRLRGPRAVARAARRAAGGRARRQAHQAGARTGDRPRSRISTMRYFGIGLYKYYADVAPAAAKVLRFLLLLPGGDETEGLAQMLRARNGGRLLQGEADYQLHVIYLLVRAPARAGARAAARPAEALPGQSALPRADRRDPGRLPARRHGQPRHLAGAAGARARAARQRFRRSPRRRRDSASRRQLEALHQTDHAIELLAGRRVARSPQAPYSSLALGLPAAGRGAGSARRARAAVAAYRSAARPRPPTIRIGVATSAARAACDARRTPAARRGVPPLARRLAAPRRRRSSGGSRGARAIARARTRRIRSRTTARPRARRRSSDDRRRRSRSSSSRSAARARARRRSSRTALPRSGASARARRTSRPTRSLPTARDARSSAPPTETRATRATRALARARTRSQSPLHRDLTDHDAIASTSSTVDQRRSRRQLHVVRDFLTIDALCA